MIIYMKSREKLSRLTTTQFDIIVRRVQELVMPLDTVGILDKFHQSNMNKVFDLLLNSFIVLQKWQFLTELKIKFIISQKNCYQIYQTESCNPHFIVPYTKPEEIVFCLFSVQPLLQPQSHGQNQETLSLIIQQFHCFI